VSPYIIKSKSVTELALGYDILTVFDRGRQPTDSLLQTYKSTLVHKVIQYVLNTVYVCASNHVFMSIAIQKKTSY